MHYVCHSPRLIPEFRDGDLKCRFPDILYVSLNDLLRVCLSEFYDRKNTQNLPSYRERCEQRTAGFLGVFDVLRILHVLCDWHGQYCRRDTPSCVVIHIDLDADRGCSYTHIHTHTHTHTHTDRALAYMRTDMRRLTTGILSEKCVVRRFRRCANVIECTYTNIDSIG